MPEHKKKQKIVIYCEHGLFTLPTAIQKALRVDEHGRSLSTYNDIKRDDKRLVELVENLKENALTQRLKVVSIPVGVKWEIENYDGLEWVSEKHREWD